MLIAFGLCALLAVSCIATPAVVHLQMTEESKDDNRDDSRITGWKILFIAFTLNIRRV